MKEIKFEFLEEEIGVFFKLNTYSNGGHLAVTAYSEDEEFDVVTVNFANEYTNYFEDKQKDMWFAYINEECVKWRKVLYCYGIAESAKQNILSGFKRYYGVIFNEEKLREYCGDEAVDNYIADYERAHGENKDIESNIKLGLTVRDLTKSITVASDFHINLPVEDIYEVINKEHEYIIVDSECLGIGEFTSVKDINSFLNYCRDAGVDKEILDVLSACGLDFYELEKVVKDDNYIIVDFDNETSGWNYGTGGNVTDLNDLGLALFNAGYVCLPFDYKDEYEEYINWERVWNEATTGESWKVVTLNKNSDIHNYLLKIS